jgi:hypothetical protein
MRYLGGYSISAVAGATTLALSLSPASALTLSGPPLEQPVVSAQIDKVWCNGWRCGYGGWRGYGWRAPGWGYGGPGWGYGGWGPGHCWRGYYGHLHCN